MGLLPRSGVDELSKAPHGLDKPMLRGANRRAIVPIVLAVWLLPQASPLQPPACSVADVSRSGASVGQQVSPERKFGWGLFKEAPLILGWFDSSERREGFCAV